jgi:AGZA family xanthine/uracil permease-like MFS transporter
MSVPLVERAGEPARVGERRMFEKLFRLRENGTTVRTELTAGLITFLTMSYIIFVQPQVLSGGTGMGFDPVLAATCLAAAAATLVMAFAANYPIALAPGMGENFFFVLSVIPAAAGLDAVKSGQTTAWQVALGVVFVSGVLFFLVYLLGIRERMLNAISPSLKNAIAVGIGLFIAFIGLKNSGLILAHPATLVQLNAHFASPDLAVFFFGLLLTAALHTRRISGSILWGILGATALSAVLRLALAGSEAPLVKNSLLMTAFAPAKAIFAAPPSITPVFLKMDVLHAVSATMVPFVLMFLFMDVFDTLGTMIGVAEQAGFVKDNRLPRANRVMLADQTGTVLGAMLGTSTTTSYIESCAGVEHGGRTGLTALTTAALFLLALFLTPLVKMVASYPAITAPALVIVGSMMVRNVCKIEWNDYSEAVPAFVTLIGVPLTYSISDGLALGFISYPIVKLLGGKGRDVSWVMYVLTPVLLLYLVFVRGRIGG